MSFGYVLLLSYSGVIFLKFAIRLIDEIEDVYSIFITGGLTVTPFSTFKQTFVS